MGADRALSCWYSVTFTNSFEVAKTRLQLEGELQSRSSIHKRVYNNAFDALRKIWQSEGIRGVNVCLCHVIGIFAFPRSH